MLAHRRLVAQQIARPRFSSPAELVAWLGAVQAQDYAGSKWALGLRLAETATDVSIERAIDEGEILRTHAFRWTWQLVVPKDLRWMLSLVGARLGMRAASRYRQLDLDAKTFVRSAEVLERTLADGTHRTRAQLAVALEQGGVSPVGQRLAHLLGHAELEGLICSGARRGKQNTYALLEHRVPETRSYTRDEALTALVARYFRSRGPATIADFVWWSGLTVAETRAGLASVGTALVSETVEGVTHYRADTKPARAVTHTSLLPAFDEYLVAYRNRDAVLDPRHVRRLNLGGGMLHPSVVVDGQVIGTWQRTLAPKKVAIEIRLFDPKLLRATRSGIECAAEEFGVFLEREASVSFVR